MTSNSLNKIKSSGRKNNIKNIFLNTKNIFNLIKKELIEINIQIDDILTKILEIKLETLNDIKNNILKMKIEFNTIFDDIQNSVERLKLILTLKKIKSHHTQIANEINININKLYEQFSNNKNKLENYILTVNHIYNKQISELGETKIIMDLFDSYTNNNNNLQNNTNNDDEIYENNFM